MIALSYMDVTQMDTAQCRPYVSPQRWQKAAGYLRETDRKLSLGAELLLNHKLKQLAPDLQRPAAYHAAAGGKLQLTGSRLHFSLSHSGVYVACAISDTSVGVDIELEAEEDLRFAERFFHPDETARILASPDRRSSFYQHWTLKESYLKCLGTGLSVPLHSFCVDTAAKPPQVTRDEERLPFALQSWKVENYQLAVCYQADAPISQCAPQKTDIRECLMP